MSTLLTHSLLLSPQVWKDLDKMLQAALINCNVPVLKSTERAWAPEEYEGEDWMHMMFVSLNPLSGSEEYHHDPAAS